MKSDDYSSLFDEAYYLQQAGMGSIKDFYEHYKLTGQQENLSPNRYFHTEWYKWQNPDWIGHTNPLKHYLEVGRFECRDPSPMVDLQHYANQTGQSLSPEKCFGQILSGNIQPGYGVYRSWNDLHEAQAEFLSAIQVTPVSILRSRQPRKYLVFIQCGPSGSVTEWLRDENRSWDVLINYYDADGPRFDFAEYMFCQPGTKFTAIAKLWNEYRSILQSYDYVLFLDDDILVTNETLNEAFKRCRDYSLDLAQLALSSSSHCIWDVFLTKSAGDVRFVNGVEIMMPILSGRALNEVGSEFENCISGFGLDFLFAKRVVNAKKDNIGVLDNLLAYHFKPIDDSKGAYYSYLRSCGINPKAELWYLIQEHELERQFHELNQSEDSGRA